MRNPGTTLAAAIGTLVDGHGRILLPELLPTSIPESVQTALNNIAIPHAPGDPHIDTDWADTGLTPAERVYGWNALEVLALWLRRHRSTDPRDPGLARAILQLRFVAGTPTDGVEATIQAHLDHHGFEMVRVRQTTFFPASRLDPANPWVEWARRSIHSTTGILPTVLPNIGGSLPNDGFLGHSGSSDALDPALLSRLPPARTQRIDAGIHRQPGSADRLRPFLRSGPDRRQRRTSALRDHSLSQPNTGAKQ